MTKIDLAGWNKTNSTDKTHTHTQVEKIRAGKMQIMQVCMQKRSQGQAREEEGEYKIIQRVKKRQQETLNKDQNLTDFSVHDTLINEG